MRLNSKLSASVIAAAVGGILFSSAAVAQDRKGEFCGKLTKSGTFVASSKNVGFLLGIRWGKGTVTLNDGTKFNISFKGLKAMETGAAINDVKGEIYNLKKPEDIIGVFYGSSNSIKLVKGRGQAIMNNSKCVVIKAKSTGKGLQLSAPTPAGIYVQLSE